MSYYEYQPAIKGVDFNACCALIGKKHPVVAGGIDNGAPGVVSAIISAFTAGGYPVCERRVDLEDYRDYVRKAGYHTVYTDYYRDNLPEKSLEHYLASVNLGLKNGGVFVDIASENSPVPDIYNKLYQVKSYRQDIMYKPGLHGNSIGGDACHMPVPDGFFDAIALTCSFEHFEGDADSKLIVEMNRVLKPGGIAYIVPFYLFSRHAVQTDPLVSAPNNVAFDDGATIYCCKGWGNRHGRFYDYNAFKKRIVPYLGGLLPEVQFIANISEVHPLCYGRFALKLTKNRP